MVQGVFNGGCDINTHQVYISLGILERFVARLRPFEISVLLEVVWMIGVTVVFILVNLFNIIDFFIPVLLIHLLQMYYKLRNIL